MAIDSFSYVRAGLSCLPGISPFANFFNIAKSLKLIKQRMTFFKTEKKELAESLDNHRIYNLCGAVGNVLAIAILIGLTVSGILAFSASVSISIGLGFQAAHALYTAYQCGERMCLVKRLI